MHGFVLAGGKSSRMGRDKAMLRLAGKPLVELAVEKLHEVCDVVSIVGNRDDLAEFAPVVRDARVDVGPGAGVEAGLLAASREWCLFVPVDVPLLPAALLREWATDVVDRRLCASYLIAGGMAQPTICLVRRSCAAGLGPALAAGERRLRVLLEGMGDVLARDAMEFGGDAVDVGWWFRNLNTPEDLAGVEVGLKERIMRGS